MFRGINLIQIDAKGRIAMPARYRARLHELSRGCLVVTIDTQEPCLLVYPLPTWELIEEDLERLSNLHKATRRVQRLLIGHATELELDGNGRFLLPPLLRDYAKLDKQIMLVGQGKKFEIWGETQWNEGRTQWLNEEGEEAILPPELGSLSL